MDSQKEGSSLLNIIVNFPNSEENFFSKTLYFCFRKVLKKIQAIEYTSLRSSCASDGHHQTNTSSSAHSPLHAWNMQTGTSCVILYNSWIVSPSQNTHNWARDENRRRILNINTLSPNVLNQNITFTIYSSI